jgi:hypothetical protein
MPVSGESSRSRSVRLYHPLAVPPCTVFYATLLVCLRGGGVGNGDVSTVAGSLSGGTKVGCGVGG